MRLVVLALTGVLLLAGCADGDPAAQPSEPTGAASTRSSPSGDPGGGPSGSAPPTPATTSGKLDKQDVPEPEALGTGWEAYADPGGAEAGFLGNGSFVRAREPAEVVMSLVPLGCPGVESVDPVPRPAAALEATYRTRKGSPAVVLVLDYPAEGTAARAIEQLAELRRSCDQTKDSGPGSTLIDLRRADRDRIWDVRRTLGEDAPAGGWLEVAVREGAAVSLLAIARTEAPDAGFPPLDRALREALRHR